MAWFTFTDASNEIFVIELRDPDAIEHARALLDGSDSSDPLIAGIVAKSAAAYNIGWSYHLEPDSIFFFEISTEVGDSTMRYIEDHLEEIGGELLPGSVWTGWSSALVDELNDISGGDGADTLLGSSEADILFGRAGGDGLIARGGDDHLVCDTGADSGFGGSGDDKLGGGAGGDILQGGRGDDILSGDEGCDRLRGGAGGDRFIIDAAGESDREVIVDFESEESGEVIQIDASWLDLLCDETGDGLVDAADVAASFTACGDDLVLYSAGNASIVLTGVDNVSAGDFLLA
jgi:Ca2+-binding RTX toxin-like protein